MTSFKFGKDATLALSKITAEFQAALDALSLISADLGVTNAPVFSTSKGRILTDTNLDITAITGIPEAGIVLLMVVGTGTVTYQNVTTAVIKKDPIKVGNYSLARIENIGTLASPILIISDAIVGNDQSLNLADTPSFTAMILNQLADSVGLQVNGFDDKSGENIRIYIDSNGRGVISCPTDRLHLEADGQIDYLTSGGSVAKVTWNQGSYGDNFMLILDGADDETKWVVSDQYGNATILTNYGNRDQDHGHAPTIDPTMFVHSDTSITTAVDEWISMFHDKTSAVIGSGKGGIRLGGELNMGEHSIGGTMQEATGDGTTTIDWKAGNVAEHQFGASNETFTFTAPTKPGTFLLKLIQDSVGSRTVTWPATVKWPGGTAPTLTTTATTGIDIITFFYDGTNYYGVSTLNFS